MHIVIVRRNLVVQQVSDRERLDDEGLPGRQSEDRTVGIDQCGIDLSTRGAGSHAFGPGHSNEVLANGGHRPVHSHLKAVVRVGIPSGHKVGKTRWKQKFRCSDAPRWA